MVFRNQNLYSTAFEDAGGEEYPFAPSNITNLPVAQPVVQPIAQPVVQEPVVPYGRAAINQQQLAALNPPVQTIAQPVAQPTVQPVAEQPAPNVMSNQPFGAFGLPSLAQQQVAAQPAQPVQPTGPSPATINALSQQILGQGTTDKWSGQGFGSAEANALDMAKIMAGIGITDIRQFGKINKTIPGYSYETEQGTVDVPEQTITTYGNKETGQEVPNTYSERQNGNFFGGTFEGKGNTGYGVQFDEQGNPLFYTQGASSSDAGKLAPLLTLASFVPGLAPVAQGINALLAAKSGNILGAISGAAGLGGLSDVANAANFAGALKSGNPLAAITTGANLGGVDLGDIVDSSGVKELTKVGNYDITDALKTMQTVKAIKSGDPSAIISAVGGYLNRGSEPSGSATGFVNPDDFVALPEVLTTSKFADRQTPGITEDVNPSDIPSIGGNPMDLLPQLPNLPKEPESFNSAFAKARANGEKIFEWNGKPYTTDLAPSKQTTYDSVGGGRGGQGGATAEELAAYNRSQMPTSVAKPKTAGDLFTSLFPSAEASTLPTGKTADLASQIPGQSYKAPPSTYADNNSVFGRVADELGLPQEFQRNVSNTLNALPGVNLPIGAVGKFVGAADELGASKYLDEAGRYIPGSNAYKAPEYASEATRMTADPMKMFKMIQDLPNDVYKTPAVQNALKAIANGDEVAAFKSLESNPVAKKELLKYAEKLGAQEVSPFKNLNLYNPAKYKQKIGGGFATGGLASLTKKS